MNRRHAQATSVLQRAVQKVVAHGFADPRIRGLITITGVNVSSDLRDATVHVSVLPKEFETLTLHGLQAASKYIRHEVSNATTLHPMPKLRIKLDQSLKQQASAIAAINKAVDSLSSENDADNLAVPQEDANDASQTTDTDGTEDTQ